MSAGTVLEGIIPILSMPFSDDDAIDVSSLAHQAEFLAGAGVAAVGFGFGSEIYRLTDAERDDAVCAVAAAVGGQIPIVAATGANSTRATILRSLAAREAGATILMITPPAFAAAGPEAVFAHYRAIAEHVGLPIIVQDAPGMTGVAMTEVLMGRLAREIEFVVAIKVEVSPPAPKVSAAVTSVAGAATVLGGAGGIDFMHELERGAAGTVPGAALPELFVEVWRLFRAGQRAEARALFNRFLPLLMLSTRTIDAFLFTQKEILRRRGVLPNARLRTPSEQMDSVFLGELDEMLNDLGLAAVGPSWQPLVNETV
jgi:4-hydroxy-tetrahydrodipicolinate synthase